MPFDVSSGSFAATAITGLFWWTVLSPLGLLAIAVLCAHELGLRLWLTLAVLVPPLLVLLPVAVMHGGVVSVVAVGAALVEAAAVTLAVAALVRRRRVPAAAAQYAAATLVLGVIGGMLGSGALVAALVFA